MRPSQRIALGVLMGIAFLLVAWMASPLLVGLALGTVMGFTAQPFDTRLERRFGNRPRLASAVTTLLGGLVMAGGGVLVVWIVANEVADAIRLVQHLLGPEGPTILGPRASHLIAVFGISPQALEERLQGQLGRVANLAATAAGFLVQASAGLILTLVVAMWTMNAVLRDWPRIARHLERLLPLHPRHTRALVAEFRDVGRRAFVGSVTTAVVQGVLAGIGFAIFGVPQAVTWGALLALLSFIPVIGVPLVWVPAAVWLLTTGHVARAILLTAWCLVLVMAVNDYVIRPRLVGRGANGGAHPLLMLVGLLGGISVFGIAGVIVGPVIVSLFVAAARIYERERETEEESPQLTSGGTAVPPHP
ncbi:MAG TPA: AI-2E family transporter [Polyangiaceae bacterium]